VVAGDILACRWVQRARQRQLDELARYTGNASAYRFNPKLKNKQGRTFLPADNLCAPHHLHPHQARLAVAGRGVGPVLAQGRELGDGTEHARRVGLYGAADDHRPTPAQPRADHA